MRIIVSLIKQFLFWMLVFAVSRMVFYIYYSGILTIESIDISDVFISFWYALPLDIQRLAIY